jgi:signal transduction histidine kinase
VQFNIYDLQDITNIAKNRFTVKMGRVNPRELLKDVVNSYQMHAHKKKQTINLKVDDNVPRCIESDPTRLT